MFHERYNNSKQSKPELSTWANLTLVCALLGTGVLGAEAMIKKTNEDLKPGVDGHSLCADGVPTGPYEISLNQGELLKIRGPEAGILGSFGYTDLVLIASENRTYVESGNIKPNSDPRITTRYSHLGWNNLIKYDETPLQNGGAALIFEAIAC